MAKKLDVSTRTKSVRDEVADFDYIDKLSDAEKQWLGLFVSATKGNDLDAASVLVGNDPGALARLSAEVYAEDNARRRDITYLGVRQDVGGDMDGEAAILLSTARQEDRTKCGRCFHSPCRCLGPRVLITGYAESDYLPEPYSEDVMLDNLDAHKRLQAYDLLPYGDSPKGLEQGHSVKVCLPMHLLDRAWGYVLDYRPYSKEYLIRSMSKHGLRDKDGRNPKATVLWVKGNGLKRFRPTMLKGFDPSSDKTLKEFT